MKLERLSSCFLARATGASTAFLAGVGTTAAFFSTADLAALIKSVGERGEELTRSLVGRLVGGSAGVSKGLLCVVALNVVLELVLAGLVGPDLFKFVINKMAELYLLLVLVEHLPLLPDQLRQVSQREVCKALNK